MKGNKKIIFGISPFLLIAYLFCTACPNSSSSDSSNAPVTDANMSDYTVMIRPFTTPPPNFNYAVCQSNFNFSQNTPIIWGDLWLNNWYIRIDAQTAQTANAWSEFWQGCGINGNAVFTTSSGTYPFSTTDGNKLKIRLPNNRQLFITCTITSMCGNCNTTVPGTVSYTWSTGQLPFDMTTASPAIPLDLGPLPNSAQLNLNDNPNPTCPCQ